MAGDRPRLLVRGTCDGRSCSLIYGLVMEGYDVCYVKGDYPDSQSVVDGIFETEADILVTALEPHGPAAIVSMQRLLAEQDRDSVDVFLTHVPPESTDYYGSVATVFNTDQLTQDIATYLDTQYTQDTAQDLPI